MRKINGRVITIDEAANNILGFYEHATGPEYQSGMMWYDNANAIARSLGDKYGVDYRKVAGIIAAFSPQCGWDANIVYAEKFLSGLPCGRTNTQKDKARAILYGSVESIRDMLSIKDDGAPKVKAFYDCISDPLCDSVVIDRHAIAAALQEPSNVRALTVSEQKITPAQYNFLSDSYKHLAQSLGILPNQLQAIVWETYRSRRSLSPTLMAAA